MAEYTVAVISALSALCAILLAPLISLYTVKRQIGVSVLSNNRQAWINALRDSISEFVTLISFVHVGNYGGKSGDQQFLEKQQILEKMERAFLLESKIQLMLNPKEDDHNSLIALIREARCTAVTDDADRNSKKWKELHDKLIPLAQRILKREWGRVKKVS